MTKTPKTLRILSVFAFLNIILEAIALTLAYNAIRNSFVFHLHTIIEFTFLMFLATKIIDTREFRIFGLTLITGFLTFCVMDALYIEGIDSINFLPRGIEGLIIIGISVYFFYRLFVADQTIDLLNYPYFWLFAGWLIYFSGTFFLFIYNNSSGFNITFPVIHSVLNIFLNLVYTYTLWLGSRKLIPQ